MYQRIQGTHAPESGQRALISINRSKKYKFYKLVRYVINNFFDAFKTKASFYDAKSSRRSFRPSSSISNTSNISAGVSNSSQKSNVTYLISTVRLPPTNCRSITTVI